MAMGKSTQIILKIGEMLDLETTWIETFLLWGPNWPANDPIAF